MISEVTRGSWNRMIRILRKKELNVWETKFVNSLWERVKVHGDDLTFYQSKKLREVATRHGV